MHTGLSPPAPWESFKSIPTLCAAEAWKAYPVAACLQCDRNLLDSRPVSIDLTGARRRYVDLNFLALYLTAAQPHVFGHSRHRGEYLFSVGTAFSRKSKANTYHVSTDRAHLFRGVDGFSSSVTSHSFKYATESSHYLVQISNDYHIQPSSCLGGMEYECRLCRAFRLESSSMILCTMYPSMSRSRKVDNSEVRSVLATRSGQIQYG